HVALRDLHSFPTRRSSDLPVWALLQIRSEKLSGFLKPTAPVWAEAPSLPNCTMRRVKNYAVSATSSVLLPDVHAAADGLTFRHRSEEHTSELQSRENLVCR